MAPATSADNVYQLSPDQQDLLLVALTSNTNSSPMFNTPGLAQHRQAQTIPKSLDHTADYQIPTSNDTPMPHSAGLSSSYADGTPYLGDNLEFGAWDADGDGTWDYDFVGEAMQHDTPDSNNTTDGGTTNGDTPQPQIKTEHEKRKEHPEGDKSLDPHDAEPKRRDDKGNESKATPAKKPGRKPLTSEPTSKRKAQNRAAQRAFRERKEKHLKDLEQKVEDLTKASESANQENSLLRAQIDRLQTELREYKRRLQTTEIARTASLGLGTSLPGFSFDFPPFGQHNSFPNGGNKSAVKQNSASPALAPTNDTNGGLSYSIPGYEPHNTPNANGRNATSSSPSASSVSHHGPGSSCGTSPEPVNGSPIATKLPDELNPLTAGTPPTTTVAPNGDIYICKSGPLDGETETTFCEKLSMACGNPHNPIPKAPQFPTTSETASSSVDWLAQQSRQNPAFDPVFQEYRDPVNDINSHLGMSFFDDAFSIPNFNDMGSPFVEAADNADVKPPKKDLMAEVDAVGEDDDEEVVPAERNQMLSCNKIWECVNNSPLKNNIDLDELCAELRSKAKCSEVGVVVAENDVQELLAKRGLKPCKEGAPGTDKL